MIIKSIELADYRNYDSLVLQFDRGTNILYGDNAQGKTNILEAIYVAATTKSHKGSKDREIVNFDKEEAHIRTYLEKDGKEIRVDMHLRKSKSKGIAIDGQKIKKAADLLGLCNVVFFSPEDLGIIKNGPSERRRFALAIFSSLFKPCELFTSTYQVFCVFQMIIFVYKGSFSIYFANGLKHLVVALDSLTLDITYPEKINQSFKSPFTMGFILHSRKNHGSIEP